MDLKTQIDRAIGAHGMWKAKLKDAIAAGKSELSPDTVAADDACEFGKWFYGSLSDQQRSTEHGKALHRIHADFHREAARILRLATAGKKAEATAALERGGTFFTLSVSLTRTLMKWQREIE